MAAVRELYDAGVPQYRMAQPWYALAWPLAQIWKWGSRRGQARAMAGRRELPVPVISVGNLTMGGTGKTPCVLRLAELLRARRPAARHPDARLRARLAGKPASAAAGRRRAAGAARRAHRRRAADLRPRRRGAGGRGRRSLRRRLRPGPPVRRGRLAPGRRLPAPPPGARPGYRAGRRAPALRRRRRVSARPAARTARGPGARRHLSHHAQRIFRSAPRHRSGAAPLQPESARLLRARGTARMGGARQRPRIPHCRARRSSAPA